MKKILFGRMGLARFIKRNLFIVMIVFIISNLIFGQAKSKITGVIVDDEFGEPLIGVNVMIEGTMLGAATDINGNFVISQLDAGEYNIIVSMVGYTKQKIEGVKLKNNETTHIEIILRTESFETKEIVISAKAVMNTEASILVKRQKSIEVSDAVSAEQFQKAGSSNAADAAKQIVGASVVDGKDVFIRGLGDRYTSTNLNGAQIPSADPYKRSGSIDIIPSNLIDNIQVVKSFTPDKPGDFSGGTIDVNTKDFPDQFNLSLSAAVKYNSAITFNKNGFAYDGSSTDWLGYDNGTRAVPTIVGDETWTADVGHAQKEDILSQQIDNVTKSFNSQMTPYKKVAPINQNYALSIGNQYKISGMYLGFIGSLTYKNNHNGYIEGQLNRWDRGVADPNKNQLDTNFALTDTKSISEVIIGGLAKVSLKLNNLNVISFNFLFNQNGESTSRFVSGKYPYDIDPTWKYQARTLFYKERNLKTYQLEGNHSLGIFNGLKIDWLASTMNSSQSDPDNRYFYNYETNDKVYGVKTNLPPERYFRTTNEEQNRFNLNLILPFKVWNNTKSRLKFGGAYLKIDRAFNERRFVYNPVSSVGKYLRDENGNVNELFSDKYLGWTSTDTLSSGVTLNRFSLYITETDQTSSNYTGSNKIFAYYGLIDLPILPSLRIITGARVESTNMRVISSSETKDDATIQTKDILPSFSIIYNPIQNMNMRFSYGRTLSRPNFREISPFQNYEFNGGDIYIGNPDLERTLIDNFDLRWEWFTNPGEVLSISLFAKNFNNPIEQKIVNAPNKVLSWTNVNKAEVYGLEFEARTKIGFLSNRTNNLQLGGNLSLIRSSVDIDSLELENRRAYEPYASSTRQFQGQSPYVINFFLDYENMNFGLTASLYYNVFGKRLSTVGSMGAPDVYEKPLNLINFTATKSLIENLQLTFRVQNLLNAKNVRVQEYKGKEYIYSSYYRGRVFSVGLNYKI
ncbi:MAG: TonB-dependent receptor [Chlorobi bacterium]|nr:TonB-dependent receptor [Chlorobiota bacterium]